MKVLQINVVYGRGSTGRIVKCLHEGMMLRGIDCVVCYGRGTAADARNIIRLAPEAVMKCQSLWAKATGYAYGGCLFSTKRMLGLIEREKPDVVHIHCINGYMVNIYELLGYLKEKGIATVITNHAEFLFTGGCAYTLDCNQWLDGCEHCMRTKSDMPASQLLIRSKEHWEKMKSVFDDWYDNLALVAVSPWLKEEMKRSPIMGNSRLKTILNGVDTDIFYPRSEESVPALRQENHIKDEKVVLYVTSNFKDSTKNGSVVLELAKRFPGEKVRFMIIGYHGDQSGLPENVTAISHTENQHELAAYYTMADLTLLTSRAETFSMVCAESLCCGTPVVGFRAGGPESIALEEYSAFVDFGDIDCLDRTLTLFLLSPKNRAATAAAGREKYAQNTMLQNYIDLYNSLYK